MGDGNQQTRNARFIVKVRRKTALEIEAPCFTVGSHGRSDLALKDPVLAPEHCRIQHRDEGFFIEDLDTVTGTYLGGELVASARKLGEGQEIVIGMTRLSVSLSRSAGAEVLTLQLRANSFHLVELSLRSSADEIPHHDRDHWARAEARSGRFPQLRRAVLAGVIITALLPFVLIFERWRNPFLSPGELSPGHAQLFVGEREHSVPEDQFNFAQREGCATCHQPFRGPVMEKCARCHGEMMRGSHPFHDSPEASAAGLATGTVRRPLDAADCSRCHREHRGDRLRLPPSDTLSECQDCHGATELEAKGFVPSRDPVPIEPQPVTTVSFSFGHDDHRRHPETNAEIPCQVCHERGERVDPTGRDFVRVSYEKCARCHTQGQRDAELREYWPAENWVVDWHGTDDPAKCRLCHTRVYSRELRSVMRASVPPADYYRFRGRYALERRSHRAHFASPLPEKPCEQCHRQGQSLTSGVASERQENLLFRHALHMRDGLSPSTDDECRACHTDRRESVALSDHREEGLFFWAPESCGGCHWEPGPNASRRPLEPRPDPPRAPASELTPHPNFPHRYHLALRGGLEKGCLTCHGFHPTASGDSVDAVPTTLPGMGNCQTCHQQHQNVGGGSCGHCHPTTGAYNVFWGPDPPADKPFPTKAWPPSSPFDHFTESHALECTLCHLVGTGDRSTDLSLAEQISSVPIPNETQPLCRGCHVGRRFHWR